MFQYIEKILQIFFKNKTIIQFFSYLILASVAAISELTTLFVLSSVLHVYYVIAVILAYPIGLSVNFFLNRKYNFKTYTRSMKNQAGVFLLVNLMSLAIGLSITYALTEYTGLWYLASRVCSLFVTLFFSFTAHKLFTFK